MNNRYEQFEDQIVALLQGFPGFDAMVLPENKADFQFANRCKVYVQYTNSEFAETDNLSAVVQNERVFFGVEFRCAQRRGETGLFAAQKIVFQQLLGHKILGCDPFQLVRYDPLEGSGPANWAYFALFSTVTRISEMPQAEIAPLLKTVEFLPPVNPNNAFPYTLPFNVN